MFVYDRRSDNSDILQDPWICDFDYRISGVDYQTVGSLRFRNLYQAFKWFQETRPRIMNFFDSRILPLEHWDYDDQIYFFYIKDYKDVVALKLILT